MFRLTVARRLALILVLPMLAIVGFAWLAVYLAHADTDRETLDELRTISAPVAAALTGELETALGQVEAEALTLSDANIGATIERLTDRGFAGVQVVEPAVTNAPINVTSNFVARASTAPAIGSTRMLDGPGSPGTVALVMGAPIVDGDRAGDVLVGLYDVSRIVGLAEAVTGEHETLLAVRNSDDEVVIFSRSHRSRGRVIGVVDDPTALLIKEVMDTGVAAEHIDVDVNRLPSVVTLTPIDPARWVLLGTAPPVDSGLFTVPWWLPVAFGAVALAAIVPIFVLRRRLKDVVLGAQQLSRGRLATQLVDDTDDEIGLLARTLQTLDERLQMDTEQRGRSAAMLQHRATHDPLTGLANRSRLVEELTAALRGRETVAVLFCDIDDFKGINDTQGHEGGDVVLKHVANELASVCGSSELLARFGGDEFCVLSRREPAEARALSRRVEQALDSTCVVNDTPLKIMGSVGLAVAKVTDTADTLLKSADLAMYREKERRRGLRRSRRAEDQIEPISPEQIRLVFQPVVELVEQRIVGVEVLARYMHPELGQLDPESFLPPGTEQGVFDRFDLEILNRSIDQLGEWLEHGVVDERFTMSLNLAPDHVSDTKSTRQVFDILRQRRVPASMLQIEVTEHKLYAHEDDLIGSLTTLREGGIKIAIDDFGVEGSNVDRLVQIPSDVVKIDRSFVSEIDVDERAETRLRAIFEIVTTEGRIAIAEGVERQGQARVLRHLGVPYGQGYLWHAPISALALTPLLGRASRWSRKKPEPLRD